MPVFQSTSYIFVQIIFGKQVCDSLGLFQYSTLQEFDLNAVSPTGTVVVGH